MAFTSTIDGTINPIEDGLYWGLLTDGGWAKKDLLSKICHTYSRMMKLGTVMPYLKKTQKYMNHVTYPLSSDDISIFSLEISKFCSINKYRYIISSFFTFFKSLKIVLIKMVAILMMSAKMATLGLRIWRLMKASMTSPTNFYHVTQIILHIWSCNESFVTVTFLWEKLS